MIHKARLHALSSVSLILFLLGLVTLWPSPSRGEYTLVVNSHERRGVWEGWGCSLAWWGNGIGGSAHESLYEDLFFTRKSVSFLEHRSVLLENKSEHLQAAIALVGKCR